MIYINIPNKIILHHSLTADGLQRDYNAINNHHIQINGWRDIGYHYIIELEKQGYSIIKGRHEEVDGAHTRGQNTSSIGICLVGDFDTSYVPIEQLNKLIKLIRDIYSRHGHLPIYGHCDFKDPKTGYAKTCPGKNFPLDYIREIFDYQDDWRIETGKRALENLCKAGLIDTPEYWIERLTQPMEAWAVFDTISTLLDKRGS